MRTTLSAIRSAVVMLDESTCQSGEDLDRLVMDSVGQYAAIQVKITDPNNNNQHQLFDLSRGLFGLRRSVKRTPATVPYDSLEEPANNTSCTIL